MSALTFTFAGGPPSIEALRILHNAAACPTCGTHVARVDVVDDLDAPRPVRLGWRLIEVESLETLGDAHPEGHLS